ncbi:transmembrane protein 145-like [Lytechinus variegatus]|uniref:transmembrane protein 145-like n=1 Tax=Lytechinus variegatus TaxID=7654 RepID=UPI001BB20D6C|nr:transmembrane protein 145-like [Lytechinus variegatus]XP_041453697.1 transmembrane protein 145-like [Lytechinus variegatus]
MTNGLKSLEREFSYDERYLMVTDLGFLFSYLGIFLVATVNHVTLFRKHLLHVTYRLFYLSLSLQLISLLLHCIAMGCFSNNGISLPRLNNSADMLHGLSSVIFVALLFLVSKGYTVTRARMSFNGSIQLAILCLLYAVSYLIFSVYQTILLDPRDILAQYSIQVAAGSIICRIAVEK